MSGRAEIARGRMKEAVGALTGNERLRTSGKSDQKRGEARRAADKAARELAAQLRHKA